MKFPTGWRLLVVVLIAAIGIDGLVVAVPKASESAHDLLIDAAVLFGIILVSVLLARLFGRRGRSAE